MTEDDQKQRLAQLEAKLAAAKRAQEPAPPCETHFTLANQAWKMVTELVAGLVIGLCIGYGLDFVLGTTPIFLVLFILMGFAAGVNVMLRSAREVQEKQLATQRDSAKANTDE